MTTLPRNLRNKRRGTTCNSKDIPCHGKATALNPGAIAPKIPFQRSKGRKGLKRIDQNHSSVGMSLQDSRLLILPEAVGPGEDSTRITARFRRSSSCFDVTRVTGDLSRSNLAYVAGPRSRETTGQAFESSLQVIIRLMSLSKRTSAWMNSTADALYMHTMRRISVNTPRTCKDFNRMTTYWL